MFQIIGSEQQRQERREINPCHSAEGNGGIEIRDRIPSLVIIEIDQAEGYAA